MPPKTKSFPIQSRFVLEPIKAKMSRSQVNYLVYGDGITILHCCLRPRNSERHYYATAQLATCYTTMCWDTPPTVPTLMLSNPWRDCVAVKQFCWAKQL